MQSTELKKINKLKGPSEDTSVSLVKEKKAITKGEGGRGEHDLLLGVGKGLKPWGQPKEWKQATSGDRTLGDPPECTRDSQDSKGGTLDEMPYSGERELIEPHLQQKIWASSDTQNFDP